MIHTERGFKLVEFAIVAAILIVLFAVITPAFIRSRHRARAKEVISNLHYIQIACERYSVDFGGYYPLFLVGAERESNILRSWSEMRGNGVSRFPVDGMTPFAMTGNSISPPETDGELLYLEDPLIHHGYIAWYPRNPFTRGCRGFNSGAPPGVFPYGGLRGDRMFDLSFGWGDTPQIDFYIENPGKLPRDSEGNLTNTLDLDAPGNFYYHPVFEDVVPVYLHYAMAYGVAQLGMNPEDFADLGIEAHLPATYQIYGFGVRRGFHGSWDKQGEDMFNQMPAGRDPPKEAGLIGIVLGGYVLDSSVVPIGGPAVRVEVTGYSSWEVDPWTGAYPDGISPLAPDVVQELKSGADGIPDWVLISLASAEIKSPESPPEWLLGW